MEGNKIIKLTSLLQRIEEGQDLEVIRRENSSFLSTVQPTDICLAEQTLLDSGVSIERISEQFNRHIQMLGSHNSLVRHSLPPTHVLRMIMCEHDMIECFLADLLEVNKNIQQMNYLTSTSSEFRRLSHILHHLTATEQHHEREEHIIFPELERRGYFAVPEIIRFEHTELKRCIDNLKELVEYCCTMDFREFAVRLDQMVNNAVPVIQNHIEAEDGILYPLAMQVIKDASVWERMKALCDEIGYCCFTHEI